MINLIHPSEKYWKPFTLIGSLCMHSYIHTFINLWKTIDSDEPPHYSYDSSHKWIKDEDCRKNLLGRAALKPTLIFTKLRKALNVKNVVEYSHRSTISKPKYMLRLKKKCGFEEPGKLISEEKIF